MGTNAVPDTAMKLKDCVQVHKSNSKCVGDFAIPLSPPTTEKVLVLMKGGRRKKRIWACWSINLGRRGRGISKFPRKVEFM